MSLTSFGGTERHLPIVSVFLREKHKEGLVSLSRPCLRQGAYARVCVGMCVRLRVCLPVMDASGEQVNLWLMQMNCRWPALDKKCSRAASYAPTSVSAGFRCACTHTTMD